MAGSETSHLCSMRATSSWSSLATFIFVNPFEPRLGDAMQIVRERFSIKNSALCLVIFEDNLALLLSANLGVGEPSEKPEARSSPLLFSCERRI